VQSVLDNNKDMNIFMHIRHEHSLRHNARVLKVQLSQYFTSLPKKWRELYLEKALRYKDADKEYYDKLQKLKDVEDDVSF
jgi:hypothetical protein